MNKRLKLKGAPLRLAIAALLLRSIMLFIVLLTGRWSGGDSGHYLDYAQKACAGDWWGGIFKQPFYQWYLCWLSPKITITPDAFDLVLPLTLQSLFLFGSQVYFFKTVASRFRVEGVMLTVMSALIFFEPVGLVYSTVLMSDALFGAGMYLALALLLTEQVIPLGIVLGFLTLNRSVGTPLIFASIAYGFLTRISYRKLFAMVLLWALIVAPLVWHNYSVLGELTLSMQAFNWYRSVAGIVAHHGEGLDFFQSEIKWMEAHPVAPMSLVYSTLWEHKWTYFLLTGKGMIRVLIGHSNVEWWYFFTGVSPMGPAWFKAQELRPAGAYQVQGFAMVFWVLGLIGFLAFNLFSYAAVAMSLKCRVSKMGFLKGFKADQLWWFVLLIFFFAFLPQVFGDARFRLPIWPLLMIVWAISARAVLDPQKTEIKI